MRIKTLLLVLAPSLLLGSLGVSETRSAETDTLSLTRAGRTECRLVVITDHKSDSLTRRAAELIADTIRLWGGVAPLSVTLGDTNPALPVDEAIVFTTLDALKKIGPALASSHKELVQAAVLDEQGFVCVPVTNKGVKQLFVVSRTPRGVYNGAVYLRDFCIDGDRQNLYAEFRPVVRSPWMGGRSAYTLTVWAQESKYTSHDWATVFQSFSRDGMDRVYFWVSGHFPSKKFPQTYKCKDVQGGKLYDTTVDSRIATIADLKTIVRSAHELGLKIYLGGGLGCWCGTQFITNLESETMKAGQKDQSLCPSNPKSRKALVDYYQELFAALPEADGVFIESADEAGDCRCSVCSRRIDALGSKQFGQSQLSLCQEVMNAIWRDYPQARLAYTIGYQEHVKDVAYYGLIRRLSNDPRFEWMEARNSWSFPGPKGESRPASSFSKKVMHWKQYYGAPLDDMIADANRIKREGMYGMSIAFEPGYGTGSFYSDIPFPTDILPYVLTGFVFREATWDPALTAQQMCDRIQRRFFGHDAPKRLGDDLCKLREIIRTRTGLEQMDAIEQRMKEARSNAGPKTMQGLNIMTRAANDIHKYLAKPMSGHVLKRKKK
jgi:hypothetical protein